MSSDPDDISSLTRRVDVARLRDHVSKLTSGPRHSLYDTAHHLGTVDYITEALVGFGLDTRHHGYEFEGRSGVNVVARMPAASEGVRPLLVSAHYDTVIGSPGADDNASGIAVMLECARILAGARVARPVEFVAFDMEEVQPEGEALVGSSAFVRDHSGASGYEALYNLEMVGYTSGPHTQEYPPGFPLVLPRAYEWAKEREFSGDFIAAVSLGEGIEVGRRFEEASRQYIPELPVLPIEVLLEVPALLDIFRSDQSPFWAVGVPAVMITDTADFRNPNYHTPDDTLETLDYDFATNVAKALVATLASWDQSH